MNKIQKCPYVVFQSTDSIEASQSTDAPRRAGRMYGKCRIFLMLWKIVFVSRESFGRHVPPVSRRSDNIFLGPFREIPDDCVGICSGTCVSAHDAGERTYTAVLFVCLPTNIEIPSLTFNITGANATHVRAHTRIYSYARTYARTTRIHEVRRLALSLHPIPLLDSMHFGVGSKDEARMNSPRTTR